MCVCVCMFQCATWTMTSETTSATLLSKCRCESGEKDDFVVVVVVVDCC